MTNFVLKSDSLGYYGGHRDPDVGEGWWEVARNPHEAKCFDMEKAEDCKEAISLCLNGHSPELYHPLPFKTPKAHSV